MSKKNDLLIRGAVVLDGTGSEAFQADIRIQSGVITAIGDLPPGNEVILDAGGLSAAPGFIDMHSHSDLRFFLPEPPEEKVRQGVTTELLGQDGLGVAPASPATRPQVVELTRGLLGPSDRQMWTWESCTDYLDALQSHGLPVNAALLVSHAPLRLLVMGMDNRPPTASELDSMCTLLDEGMRQGAFGLSTGLIYPPCSFSDTAELVALNRTVAAHGGVFVVHQRDEGYHLPQSFQELLAIGRQSGVNLHISHFQAMGSMNWPFMDNLLQKIQEYRSSGGAITWDRYPYTAGCTMLTAVLPPWVIASTSEGTVANLSDPSIRPRIHEEFHKGLDVWNNRAILIGWDKTLISAVASEKNHWMEGRDIASLATASAKDPVDFICNLLVEENLAVNMISFYGSQQVLEKVLLQDGAVLGSDGIAGGRPHPRLFGTYPRFLREFVREHKLLTLPQAIHKMSSLPARILGMQRRGLLQQGYAADLVLFDAGTITDTATYDRPESFPTGIETVLVNGVPAVEHGRFTGRLAGAALRKTPGMV